MRIVILTPAKEEILESSLFYLEQSPQAAIKFEDELDAAWSSLRSNPERYRIHSDDVRILELDRFPFSILYRIVGDEVHVLSVAHHARRPGFWAGR